MTSVHVNYLIFEIFEEKFKDDFCLSEWVSTRCVSSLAKKRLESKTWSFSVALEKNSFRKKIASFLVGGVFVQFLMILNILNKYRVCV